MFSLSLKVYGNQYSEWPSETKESLVLFFKLNYIHGSDIG